ncbi:fungal-specific transcription factor domain-containing protein [Annulohypoxylon maeteangense]|uniref:fungal-specific transcription factor domain-containing protein n=1 Tax=Annulohypoxylon maeteangense TaxID=1927788 RepID=UPI0020089CDC|nr:fungal-specific transcription factor domain-containing protein [Annulohypoxylon maeteangense]KAI0881063.1 fungal-specific transcription factor domain-containing protein [Annulohypoxylon maeteangense]
MQSNTFNDGRRGVPIIPTEASGISGSSHSKRTRVLLSCAPCRNSKLKCDRSTPCGQCLRKGKPDGCLYAPRPEKQKPAKSMAARLKRLEGMVRVMIDTDGSTPTQSVDKLPKDPGGVVVQGQGNTSYVGGTHFMAMLEDIEDLKGYFDDRKEDEEETHDPYENMGPTELLMASRNVPKDKNDLLASLPEKAVVSRLMNRYFNSNSPSQHIIHVPTFLREYNIFCKDPQNAPLHWIALLYMILALGTFFSSFSAPHELESDSPVPALDRFKQYRGAAGWALIWGKYSQPGPYTLEAFMLYVEGDFVTNRENRMNCYLLSSVLIRLMLKMGLHRDPSKLPGITPYDGEMRRRMWNLAVQIDLLVAFNLGLPSMTHAIESDTALPQNLTDSDFDKDTKELPQARPSSDYTLLTYPINKARVSRIFFLVVQQAHSLDVPSYAEVMKVDAQIEEAWDNVPSIMKMRPMDLCLTDAPVQIIQRFGIAAIYQKSRCIHHRRYIVEENPKREHDYSRRVCLEAALALLDYQITMHEAGKPGGMLAQSGWFIAALVAVNDFLLANMIVALVIQNDKYWEPGGDADWISRCMPPTITRDELLRVIRRSHYVWQDMAVERSEFQKCEKVTRIVLRRVHAHLGIITEDVEMSGSRINRSGEMTEMASLTIDGSRPATVSSSDEAAVDNIAGFGMMEPNLMTGVSAGQTESDPLWMMQNGYDWSYFDAMARTAETMEVPGQITEDAWIGEKSIGEFPNFMISNTWNFPPSS